MNLKRNIFDFFLNNEENQLNNLFPVHQISDIGLLPQMFADFPMDSYLVKLEATNALSKTGKNVFKDDRCRLVYNDGTFGTY